MHNPEHSVPVENGEGDQDQSNKEVINQFALEDLARKPEIKGVSEERLNEMFDRLKQLNREIPALAEELHILEHPLGALQPDEKTSRPTREKLSQQDFEKIQEARFEILGKIKKLEQERDLTENMLFPDTHLQLKQAREELGLSSFSKGTDFGHSVLGGVWKHPETPPAKPEPDKTGLLAKLKGFFGKK